MHNVTGSSRGGVTRNAGAVLHSMPMYSHSTCHCHQPYLCQRQLSTQQRLPIDRLGSSPPTMDTASKIADLQAQIKAACTLLAGINHVHERSLASTLLGSVNKWHLELDALTATLPQPQPPQPQPQPQPQLQHEETAAQGDDDAAGPSSWAKRPRKNRWGSYAQCHASANKHQCPCGTPMRHAPVHACLQGWDHHDWVQHR
jgi:hypothetical protein